MADVLEQPRRTDAAIPSSPVQQLVGGHVQTWQGQVGKVVGWLLGTEVVAVPAPRLQVARLAGEGRLSPAFMAPRCPAGGNGSLGFSQRFGICPPGRLGRPGWPSWVEHEPFGVYSLPLYGHFGLVLPARVPGTAIHVNWALSHSAGRNAGCPGLSTVCCPDYRTTSGRASPSAPGVAR